MCTESLKLNKGKVVEKLKDTLRNKVTKISGIQLVR